jgi:serine/threonine protein kinase
MLLPSSSLDGYRILRQVGAGGFGEIWVCQSEALGDLRALKFIHSLRAGLMDKEFHALALYRNAAGKLRSPALMPVEHANLRPDGLFYIMPLADGLSAASPLEEGWQPKTLSALIERQRAEPAWFSSRQITEWMRPILEGLQLLSDAGLVHRDVKTDNILFLNGSPCLSDISLLGEDTQQLTRRGTPGFAAPSWFVESGGHPDIYGAAMTLYSLLSGNPPDKIGRSNFRWPPQGEASLPTGERNAWVRLHAAIRRAVDERPAERFADFRAFARALDQGASGQAPGAVEENTRNPLTSLLETVGRNRSASVLWAGLMGFGLLLLGFWAMNLGHRGAFRPTQAREEPDNKRARKNTPPEPESARADIEEFERELLETQRKMTFPRETFAAAMEEIAADLSVLDPENKAPPGTSSKPLAEIKAHFLNTLKTLPRKPDVSARNQAVSRLRTIAGRIGDTFGPAVRESLEEKIRSLESDLNTDSDFRKEQGMKVLKRATRLVNIRPESWDIIKPAQNFTFGVEP